MRIIVVQPGQLHITAHGASDQDQVTLLGRLKALGHDVTVFTRTAEHVESRDLDGFLQSLGVHAQILKPQYPWAHPKRFMNLGYLDGAAWQYGDPVFLRRFGQLCTEYEPELIWSHFSFCWPAALTAHRKGIPTVIRSINYEPSQYLQEHRDCNGPGKWLRYGGKLIGEHRALQASDVLAAITPREELIYQGISRDTKVKLLPLLSLQSILAEPCSLDMAGKRMPLKVVFMGASYRVRHNLDALKFIATQVVPIMRARCPDKFRFHIVGSKVPDNLLSMEADDLRFEGFVPDIHSYLRNADLAVAPSLCGTGMQQKVFEPLCRGIPTVTHGRALAGYSLADGQHLLLAESAEDFATQLIHLLDLPLRHRIGRQGRERARKLFGQKQMDDHLEEILRAAIGRGEQR